MRNDKINIETAVPLMPAEGTKPSVIKHDFEAERRLQTPIWVYDIDNSRIIHANASACELWQTENEDILRARDLTSDMSSTVAKRLKQYQSDFIERDATFSEMWTLYPKGKPTSVKVIFRGFVLPDGRMAMQCEVVGRTDSEPENLRSAEALLHTDVLITLYSTDGPPFYMNPAARNAAVDPQQSIRETFVHPADYANLVEKLEQDGEHRMVANMVTGDGLRWHDLSAKKCSDAVTGKPAILLTAIDVSELKIARDKARYLANRDQLTGCFNRSYLQQHMSMLEQFRSTRCALLCFDVDRFKQINDRLGHEMGDVVLNEIATRAKATIRKNDIIVRLGGDEFVIIFEDIPTETQFAPKLQRLMEVISKPITNDATRVSITVSMGVTLFTPGSSDFASIIRKADIALYASKQAGRNRVTFFNEEMGTAAKERDVIETELKQAIQRQEFVMHYQPRVDLRLGKVVSVEGLIRWQHPTRGLIMPNDFIPVCEETGLIEDLGQLILRMGCEQAIAWHRAGRNIELSLNISPRQFDDEGLMQALEAFSRLPDFPRGKIELEITETVLIGDNCRIERKLEAISQMGYCIAIDDFGTGYSNLSYISRFPLNCLKIDQSFIMQLPKSGPIISLILTLAKQIGATVVAEGVETQNQLDWLQNHDCDQVQGFLLSHPVSLDKLDPVIEDLNKAL